MTTIPKPKAPAAGYTAKYDAWNRLVELKEGSTVKQTNTYDGLNRRIIRDETGGSGVLRHFYYNENWQVLEERVGSATTADRQYVYHPHYIDALAMSINASGTKHFYTQDDNFNVTAAINSSGSVVERYHYSPYGEVTYLNPNFSKKTTQSSSIENEILFTGRRLDPETGLQLNRNRFYHAKLGRWITVDPILYEGGYNLYGYVKSNPVRYNDPSGLKTLTQCDEEYDSCERGARVVYERCLARDGKGCLDLLRLDSNQCSDDYWDDINNGRCEDCEGPLPVFGGMPPPAKPAPPCTQLWRSAGYTSPRDCAISLISDADGPYTEAIIVVGIGGIVYPPVGIGVAVGLGVQYAVAFGVCISCLD